MEVEETTEIVDEVSNPAESETTGADDIQNPETEVKSDFNSLFSLARKETTAQKNNSEETETLSDENPESDEQLPEEEGESEEAKENSEGDKKDDQSEAEKEEIKKTSRGENYKKMQEARDAALSENTAIKERLDGLDERFEKYGGVDVVETAIELFDLAADKTKADEFVSKINELPHKGLIQKTIFDNALNLPANRIYGFNHVLQTDFGMEDSIDQPKLEKILEFISLKINSDAEGFEQYLDRELEFLSEPESELERLKAENARLKNPPKETKEESQEEDHIEFARRIQTTYNDFEDKTFNEVSVNELDKFGFSVSKNDTQEVKQAKEFLVDALKYKVAMQMRDAKAHENLLDFWMSNEPENNKFYTQARKQYKNAMILNVQKALKSIAPLLGATKPAANQKSAIGSVVETAANRSDKASLPVPPKKDTKPLGFSAAFGEAKKAIRS